MKQEGLAESKARSKVQAMVDKSLEVSVDKAFLLSKLAWFLRQIRFKTQLESFESTLDTGRLMQCTGHLVTERMVEQGVRGCLHQTFQEASCLPGLLPAFDGSFTS